MSLPVNILETLVKLLQTVVQGGSWDCLTAAEREELKRSLAAARADLLRQDQNVYQRMLELVLSRRKP